MNLKIHVRFWRPAGLVTTSLSLLISRSPIEQLGHAYAIVGLGLGVDEPMVVQPFLYRGVPTASTPSICDRIWRTSREGKTLP
jgi:hypothetical protein